VYNCAAVGHRGLVHLVYRATDIASGGQDGAYISNLGYAVSVDGLHFNRLEDPILCNDVEQERRGPEDPRIVFIDNTFFMTYTGYGGRFDGDYRICLGSSANLIDWERHGVLLDEPNKDAALFPERVAGWYLMLHRRPPDIWLAYSENLLHWYDHRVIMRAKPGSDWENIKIGAAGPPVLTPDGWLLIYHGVGTGRRYCLGAALLDRMDPTKVLARQREPILVPQLDWETEGYVPNVVFSCGQVAMGNDLYVYYGAADTSIGVAAMGLDDLDLG
jgi:predicted GH43/DUF377 family glycosyl hydrolase